MMMAIFDRDRATPAYGDKRAKEAEARGIISTCREFKLSDDDIISGSLRGFPAELMRSLKCTFEDARRMSAVFTTEAVAV